MKDKIAIKILLISILSLSVVIKADDVGKVAQQTTQSSKAEELIVYTIQGKKDPRLTATFLASYVSTSRSEACSNKQATTSSRKVRIVDKAYLVTDDNYRIQIPIFLKENETECGYRFSRIELVLRRKYDNNLYSKHIVLDRTPMARAIYQGSRGGFSAQANLQKPAKLTTSKKYFRVSKETNYKCETMFYPTKKDVNRNTSMTCHMEIKDGQGENQFVPINPQRTVVTHPEFGADQIKSEMLTINIIADDKNSKLANGKEVLPDYFRVLPKPEPSLWQKIKNEIITYFN